MGTLGPSEKQLQVFELLRARMTKVRRLNEPLTCFFTGVDTAGKTELTESLAVYLKERGEAVQIIHVDDFHFPRRHRYAGDHDEATKYYNQSFDVITLVERVFRPLRQDHELHTELTVLDLKTDRYDKSVKYEVPANGIVLVEGVFLMRQELRQFSDLVVFLDIPFEEMLVRSAQRDVPDQGEQVLDKYRTKYQPAQASYLEMHDPWDLADVIIDNAVWSAPKVTKQ